MLPVAWCSMTRIFSSSHHWFSLLVKALNSSSVSVSFLGGIVCGESTVGIWRSVENSTTSALGFLEPQRLRFQKGKSHLKVLQEGAKKKLSLNYVHIHRFSLNNLKKVIPFPTREFVWKTSKGWSSQEFWISASVIWLQAAEAGKNTPWWLQFHRCTSGSANEVMWLQCVLVTFSWESREQLHWQRHVRTRFSTFAAVALSTAGWIDTQPLLIIA